MKKNNIYISLILIITTILLFKLFTSPRLYGHDTIFHTGNIYYLSKTINIINIFGSKIIRTPVTEYGYGTWLFYPKLPHLLGAYMYKITSNLYLSMNIVYFITTFLSGVIAFFLSKKLFNNSKVAFLSSVIYLTYSYHICEIYTRDAFAENFMFMVIPLIFLGLFELKDNNPKKYYLFFISGYVIGIHSHLISMVFCTIFVFFFLIYYRKVFLTIKNIKRLIISTLIVTGISLPFLMTIIEHRIFGNYVVFTGAFSSRILTTNNVIPIIKYIDNNKSAIFNDILVYINYSVFLLIVITTIIYFFKKNRSKYKEERKLLFLGSLMCIAFINSKHLWSILPSFLVTIQFPWRIMTFFSLIISLYAPTVFLIDYKINKLILNIIYILIIIISIDNGINNINYFGEEQYSFNKITNSIDIMGWSREYLPVKFLRNYHIYGFDSKSISILEDNDPTLIFETKNYDKSKIIIPRAYYLGYQLYDNNNNKYKLKESDNGLIETNINKDGIYTLKYTGTIIDKVSNIIKIITIIIAIIGGSRLWKKAK